MRIEAVICISLLACLLSACSSPPTLSEPKGAFISFNPESPSYLSSENTSKISHQVKKQPERMWPVKNPVKDNPSLTSHPLRVTQPPQGNTSSISSQPTFSPPKTTTGLTDKPLTSMTLTAHPKPAQTWQIAKGMTLKEGVMAWAIKAPCLGPGVKNWTVYWQTPVHYQIEAPLHFRGDFKSALRSVLELYQSARKPLYAQIHSAQCLIRITDKPPRE